MLERDIGIDGVHVRHTLVLIKTSDRTITRFLPSITQRLSSFFDTNFRSLGPGEPLARASNETGVGKNGEKYADFRPVNHISETIENRHTVTIIDFDY